MIRPYRGIRWQEKGYGGCVRSSAMDSVVKSTT